MRGAIIVLGVLAAVVGICWMGLTYLVSDTKSADTTLGADDRELTYRQMLVGGLIGTAGIIAVIVAGVAL
jgi:hypothetical protein